MRVLQLLFTAACLYGSTVTAQFDRNIPTFANATIFNATSNRTSASYARTETLPGNLLLATWNDFGGSSTHSTLPVYLSLDSGKTWGPWGSVKSNTPGRRLVQPHLLYLDEDFGEEDGGVLLLACNAADNRSTNIELYASYDEGRNFEFTSHIAVGGRGNTTNGATPVWEPYLLRHEDKLIVYYSDQRDPDHGQKLVQQTTTNDFDSWGPVVDVVASPKYSDRPGMLIVTPLPNAKFFMVFEYAQVKNGTNGTSDDYTYPIYYKLADSPEFANNATWHKLVVDTGARPNGGPTSTWSPVGGENGTIVVSDSDNRPVWTNQMLGEGIWKQVDTPHGRSYSREVRVPDNDDAKIRITGGAEYEAEPPNVVKVTIIDLEKDLGEDDDDDDDGDNDDDED